VRGWTATEQLALTRLLSFGRRNLLFSCSSGSWYSSGPNTSFHSLSQYGLNRIRVLSGDSSDGALWREIVGWYGASTGKFHSRPAGFTDVTDTFPAISRLARSYAAAAGFAEADYAAGLWKPTFLRDLLWTMNDQNWANRGKVSHTFLDDDDGEHCAVKPEYDQLDTRVVHRGKDPLGAVTHAELQISGKVARVPAPQMLTVEKEKGTIASYATDYQPRAWVLATQPGEHKWQFQLDWDPEGKVQDCQELGTIILENEVRICISDLRLALLYLYQP